MRPPDGPPDEEPWGFARGFRSLFQWPQQNAAPPLPPLTASGLRGLHEDGDQDGGVHRPAATSPGLTQANGIFRADERTKFPLRHVLQHNEGLWRLRGVTGSPRHEN